MRVEELSDNAKVGPEGSRLMIAIPQKIRQDGSVSPLCGELVPKGNNSELRLTHIGLYSDSTVVLNSIDANLYEKSLCCNKKGNALCQYL